ncbi:actin-binding LIM protein 1 [Leptonychotes weddellii]|uniref:Actin-binding LIM protein 1 n=1 Tax=Leptonychotes weddellii TaxID=9713 RepID=A0A2U3YM63_LEPWE|nr:actin-binding LIM protein 1 [Leptonychotes weddellii]
MQGKAALPSSLADVDQRRTCLSTVCGCDLAQGGFFIKNGEYLCTLDYQRMYGTRCHGCGEFVEGEVVTALGKTYHPNCFACTICKRPFPPGDRVTFNGRDCLCQLCSQPMSSSPKEAACSSNCAGCGRDIKNGQALLALDKQWHLGCFKCKSCGKVLTGEYISKDGAPYCEKDYQGLFGVKCEACHQFITGKVLEAGDKHYHPSCARCSRCNQMFTEGEEMYLQGSTVWHPDCKQSTKTEEKLRLSNTHRSSSDFFYPKSLVRRTGLSPSLQVGAVSRLRLPAAVLAPGFCRLSSPCCFSHITSLASAEADAFSHPTECISRSDSGCFLSIVFI